MNEEIMTESWQMTCGQNEQEDDDDDGLAEEEANLEHVSNLSDIMRHTTRECVGVQWKLVAQRNTKYPRSHANAAQELQARAE